MAIYGDLVQNATEKHCVFESSRMKSSIVGHIYDAIVRDGNNKEIEIDNGMAVKVGAYTGDGLQTRYATIAAAGNKIAVVGTPALIKDAFTTEQKQDYNFYNKAGSVVKAYEVVAEDIFGVSKNFVTPISEQTAIKVGDTVVWDTATKKYKVTTSSTSTYGFIGKIHSVQTGTFYDMVRIECVQNEAQA